MREIDRYIPPRAPPNPRSRSTRSWLPFLGEVLHTVAGTATEEEIAKALNATDAMRKTQVTAFNQWSKAEGDIASLTRVVDDRMNALQRLITDQRQAMIYSPCQS